jgi:hypothetical protein
LVTQKAPDFAAFQKKWGTTVTTSVSIVCALLATILDVNPQEHPVKITIASLQSMLM